MALTLSILVGFLLDLWLRDPLWLPHPVVGIGWLIAHLERPIRRLLPRTVSGERLGGAILWLLVMAVTGLLTTGILLCAGWVHPVLRWLAETWLCYQILAAGGLREAGMRVYRDLQAGDLEAARRSVGRVVGRDTARLDRDGVIRAAVETVAENTSDGVIAPLFFLLIGGAPLGMLYKAVNTMDSMLGYKNAQYLHFGWAAARLDDLANWLPARLSGLMMVLAAPCVGLSRTGAWTIFRRDRRAHSSPNAAHTEAACAGALGVRLAGDAVYFGKTVHKPTVGDARRPIEAEDIPRACRLMLATALLALALGILLRTGILVRV